MTFLVIFFVLLNIHVPTESSVLRFPYNTIEMPSRNSFALFSDVNDSYYKGNDDSLLTGKLYNKIYEDRDLVEKYGNINLILTNLYFSSDFIEYSICQNKLVDSVLTEFEKSNSLFLFDQPLSSGYRSSVFALLETGKICLRLVVNSSEGEIMFLSIYPDNELKEQLEKDNLFLIDPIIGDNKIRQKLSFTTYNEIKKFINK